MDKKRIVEETKQYVMQKSYGEGSGHDWWHIERVYHLAKLIASKEKANLFVVEMAALLHDLDDWKFSNNNFRATENYLLSVNISPRERDDIMNIIKTMSFKGGVTESRQKSMEGKIVQDADRLDAMGAIGIARAFTYGGYRNQPIYDPHIEPRNFTSVEEVKELKNHTVNHFYEKLFKLKDLMNTETAKEIANRRHRYMETFLKEFYSEWNQR
ncbi:MULTISPECIES: HD domain-containing protein [Bacillus]|uniref:HD domain-containing protein n=1 Tax=Bacillus TaxID=1386 RepID=UPI000376FF12|nr:MULTISPECIES: HD domain-containing protein [Bacillus]